MSFLLAAPALGDVLSREEDELLESLDEPWAQSFGLNMATTGDWSFVLDRVAVHAFHRGSDGVTHEVQFPSVFTQSFLDSIDADGDTVVVGCFRDSTQGFNSGAAYVFELTDDDSWEHAATLFHPFASEHDVCGSSVAVKGDKILIGCPGDIDGGDFVMSYERDHNGVWQPMQRIVMDEQYADPGNQFGSNVMLSANTAVILAPFFEVDALGSAWFYEQSNQNLWANVSHISDIYFATTGGRFQLEDDRCAFLLGPAGVLTIHVMERVDGNWNASTQLVIPEQEGTIWDVGISRIVLRGDQVLITTRPTVSNFENVGTYLFQLTSNDGWRSRLRFVSSTAGEDVEASRVVATFWGGSVLIARMAEDVPGRCHLYNIGTRIDASDVSQFAAYGTSVDMSDDFAIVGAPRADGNAGKAYILQQQPNGNWEEFNILRPVGWQAGEEIGQSVSISDTRAVIGAPGVFESAGSVVFYQFNGDDQWVDAGEVYPDDYVVGDRFGHAVCMDGYTAIIGAPMSNASSGAVYIYEDWGEWGWVLMSKIMADDPIEGELFGWSVDIVGDRLIVGAPNSVSEGHVYIFERQPGSGWTQTASSFAVVDETNFGWSVALAEGGAVVGEPTFYKLVTDQDRGRALFLAPIEPGSTVWTYDHFFDYPDETATQDFGRSVAAQGRSVVIGAPAAELGEGRVLHYHIHGDSKTMVAELVSPTLGNSDLFGSGVAIHNGQVMVGAPFDDNHGAVYSVGPEESCVGDVDLDGLLGLQDIDRVLMSWGCVGGRCKGDGNRDHIVNVFDLLDVLTYWGPCDPPA